MVEIKSKKLNKKQLSIIITASVLAFLIIAYAVVSMLISSGWLGGDDLGGRRFSDSGRAVKDHIGDATALDHAANDPALPEQVRLSDDVVKIFGAKQICQLCVSHTKEPSVHENLIYL